MEKNTNQKPLPVKIVNPIVGVTLYFCPKCETGHMLEEGQKVCERCNTHILWPKVNFNKENA